MPKRKVDDVLAETHTPSQRILRNTQAASKQNALVASSRGEATAPPRSTAVAPATVDYDDEEEEADLDALLDAATTALEAQKEAQTPRITTQGAPLMVAKDGVVKLDPGIFHAETEKLSVAQAAQRAKEKGTDWFELKTPELTESLKRDLQILRMRSILDPKRHYRKENTRTIGADAKKLAGPRFEVGTLLADATESAAHKIRRKDQRQTIVEELLADGDRRAYLKRKQAEIDQQKRSGGKKFYKGVKDRRGSRFSKAAN